MKITVNFCFSLLLNFLVYSTFDQTASEKLRRKRLGLNPQFK